LPLQAAARQWFQNAFASHRGSRDVSPSLELLDIHPSVGCEITSQVKLEEKLQPAFTCHFIA
jgi:hypothetical protein